MIYRLGKLNDNRKPICRTGQLSLWLFLSTVDEKWTVLVPAEYFSVSYILFDRCIH